MNVLLDTHIALWAITDDERMSGKARNILLSDKNEIYCSCVSAWEISIKHSLHPEHMPITAKEFANYCGKSGYAMLPVELPHILALDGLARSADAPKHKDPFDRMLIAQAKAEDMLFMTHDRMLLYYNEKNILPV